MNAGAMRKHEPVCLGPDPTVADLYRIGRVEIREDGCHVWGTRALDPYGLLPLAAARQLGERKAHRAVVMLTDGPIPAGMGVLHSCDNPPCIRREHLRLGTSGENAADAVARGRHYSPGVNSR